jgi:hypothetical protein
VWREGGGGGSGRPRDGHVIIFASGIPPLRPIVSFGNVDMQRSGVKPAAMRYDRHTMCPHRMLGDVTYVQVTKCHFPSTQAWHGVHIEESGYRISKGDRSQYKRDNTSRLVLNRASKVRMMLVGGLGRCLHRPSSGSSRYTLPTDILAGCRFEDVDPRNIVNGDFWAPSSISLMSTMESRILVKRWAKGSTVCADQQDGMQLAEVEQTVD